MMERPSSAPSKGLLEAYVELLERDGVRFGLIAKRDATRVWERHVLDSLRAVRCLRRSDRVVADVGSGGGLPGIPVAIARPDLRVVLIESRTRRAAFLERAVERLRLANVQVVAGPARSVREVFDAALARALGPADRTWSVVAPLLRPEGVLVYFAGRTWSAAGPEVSELVAAGVHPQICSPAEFPWQGPLVIMSRDRKNPSSRPDR